MAAAAIDWGKFPLLVVDDEQDNLDAFRFNFAKTFTLHLAGSAEDALGLAKAHDVAVVVTDQRMPRMTGLELLRALREVRPDAVGIIITAFTDVDVLIEAINLGRIYRYVTKPWDSKELRGILLQAVERFHLVRENRRLADQLEQYAGILSREAHGAFNYGEIVGDSPGLRDVLARVEQVAQTSSTVLLRGETGTGKELVARAIHINSPREARPFVRVNCAALATGVLESELFGHEKGAFTGAVARRPGRFELADGGTLFLDEVGDLPMDVQVKLLRVLQEREFERVGGLETLKVDVRVVSATHRDLEQLVAEGKFRQDLYYRLNVFPVTLPPLRDRPGDIALLSERRGTGGAGGPDDLPLAGERPRAGEHHRAGHDPGPGEHPDRGRSGFRATPRARTERNNGPPHGPPCPRWQRAGPLAVQAAVRAGAQRDRGRGGAVPGQHRARRPGPGHQPVHPVLPDAQARAGAPPAHQGRVGGVVLRAAHTPAAGRSPRQRRRAAARFIMGGHETPLRDGSAGPHPDRWGHHLRPHAGGAGAWP
jgi:DNA-binding NtrC family response regulator